MITNSFSECGGAFLELSEWNAIHFSNPAGNISLVRNWTNKFDE